MKKINFWNKFKLFKKNKTNFKINFKKVIKNVKIYLFYIQKNNNNKN